MTIKEYDFESLFKAYHNQAYRLAFLITNDVALANDIVQEAFIIVYKKINMLREKQKFKFWLNKIVINCTNKAIKKNSKYYLVENIDSMCDKVPHENEDPLLILEIEERNKLLFSILASLKDVERQVFALRYYEEYSFKEIAETLGINENTARSIIFRGKKDY